VELNRKRSQAAKSSVKRAISRVQEAERKEFSEKLDGKYNKGEEFRGDIQMIRQNRDVVGSGCVKNVEGKVAVAEEKALDIWKSYYDKLWNEELVWDTHSLSDVNRVSGPSEKKSVAEVKAAITKMKNGKAAGLSRVVSEMLKASGEAGPEWVTCAVQLLIMVRFRKTF